MPSRTWCSNVNSLPIPGRISGPGSLERGGGWCGGGCALELTVRHWCVFGPFRHLCLSTRLVGMEGGVSDWS